MELGGEEIIFSQPVIVEGTATNVESGILVDCTIRTGITVNCDRCLRPFDIQIETTAVEEYVEGKNSRTAGSSDEREFKSYKGSVLDISEMIEENILLSVPMKNVCSAACKGICPSCGADLNLEECTCSRQEVDPRMEKLKSWFNQ